MKLCKASIALLGLPAVFAAVPATYDQPQDAHASRPTPAQRLLGTGTQPKEPNSLYRSFLEKIWREDKDTAVQAGQATEQLPAEQNLQHHGLKKRVAQMDASSSSSRTTVPVINTFTDLSSSSSSAAPTVTKLAVFTIENLAWTITSAGGIEAVDGKTLTPGGAPINIAGHDISDPATGGVVIDGSSTLTFTRYIAPSSSSAAASSVAAGPGPSGPISASASASGSASSAAGGRTSTSGGAAAPAVTAGVGAVIGAFVGAIGAAVL